MTGIIALGMPGVPEMLLIAFVGLLVFGKRLPSVARSIGKSIVEFKKGIRDVKDEVDTASDPKHMLDSKASPSLPSTSSPTQQSAGTSGKQEVVESSD